jgi:transposase
MKKVELTMNAQEKYEIIKSTVQNGNKLRAAVKLGCTVRHINRLINKYQQEGKAAFIHGNTGRQPAHTLSDDQRSSIIAIYSNKYWDTNFTHCCELLALHDGIKLSPSTLRKILYEEFILSPRATRRTKKYMTKLLRQLRGESKSNKEKTFLESSIVSIENAHSRRSRCAHFGEMLQMDASLHLWFGSDKSQLHIAIDDSTGTIVGAYFDPQETLKGYYNVLNQILHTYGIPSMIFTDNRTVFEYNKKNTSSVEEDTFTQFSYACKQLGIEIQTSSVAQAKGRVERAFQTLQSRLPVELRLAGITTIEEANLFLNHYVKEYNAKFALPINHTKSVFVVQPDSEIINQTLAVLTERTVDCGHCIRFENKYFKTMDAQGLQIHFRRGTKGMVIKAFDGQLLFASHDKVYALDEIPINEKASKNFDFDYVPKEPRKRYIPDMKHPWRSDTFWKHTGYRMHPREFTA